MSIQFLNLAFGTLQVELAIDGTTIAIQGANWSEWDSVSELPMVLTNGTNYEFVKGTNVVGNVITIARATESASRFPARVWPIGTTVLSFVSYAALLSYISGITLTKAGNLAGLGNTTTARMNLGLGSAAAQNTSAFDASGAASTAQAFAIQRANHTGTQLLSTISNAGTAASHAATDFDAAGAAVAAAAASLPLAGGNLTGNVTGGNITLAGNSTAAFFIGDGSQLTGLPSPSTPTFEEVTISGATTDQAVTFGNGVNVDGGSNTLNITSGSGNGFLYFVGDTNSWGWVNTGSDDGNPGTLALFNTTNSGQCFNFQPTGDTFFGVQGGAPNLSTATLVASPGLGPYTRGTYFCGFDVSLKDGSGTGGGTLNMDGGVLMMNNGDINYANSVNLASSSGHISLNGGALQFDNTAAWAASSDGTTLSFSNYDNGVAFSLTDNGVNTTIDCHGNQLANAVIAGVADNSLASAAQVGEEIASTIAVGSAVSLTSATAKTVTSISLTAGDWQIDGTVDYHPGTLTTASYLCSGSSTTTDALDAQDTFAADPFAVAAGLGIDPAIPIPLRRVHLATTTTIYLVAKAAFATSTMTAYGTIHARRVR